MRKLMVGMLAAGMLLPAADAAAFDPVTYGPWGTFEICAPGAAAPSYFACASADVSFIQGAQNQIVLTVRNTGLFQNNTGVTDWGYGITGIGITSPTVAGGSLAGVTGTTPLGIGDPGAGWSFATQISGLQVQAGADLSGMTGAIWGCYGTPGGTNYFDTCNANQTVTFTFNTSSDWSGSASDVQVYFAMRGQSGYQGDSYRCSDDPTETSALDCQFDGGGGPDTTVPEPISLVLLGSGLIGIAGASRRRRNRQ